jgi:hypothetical protein
MNQNARETKKSPQEQEGEGGTREEQAKNTKAQD